MLQGIRQIFSLPELRKRIYFTLLMLAVCRIGAYISVPTVNSELVEAVFKHLTGGVQNLFQLVDIFSGGAFSRLTVFALGVGPYISASIVMQVLTAVMPSLQREMRENSDMGRKKMAKWIRLLTVAFALVQSIMYARFAYSFNVQYPGIVLDSVTSVTLFGQPVLFYLITVAAMTAGCLILMWIGEQISEKGVGNGISLIISVGILSSLPSIIGRIVQQLNLDSQESGQLTLISVLMLFAIFVVIITGTILIVQGVRKIPLQYARRIVGRREAQGGSSHIPLKVNYAGVIPVIFASAILVFPATVAQLSKVQWLTRIASYLTPGLWTYTIAYVILILLFTYVWTATQFQPAQIASDMKKNGAFIPGIKQGKHTQEFLETTMNRITLIGAVSLAFIAVLPTLIAKFLYIDASISQFFGGTSLLILVGVALDTSQQIESHLIMKRYDGFMKKRRI